MEFHPEDDDEDEFNVLGGISMSQDMKELDMKSSQEFRELYETLVQSFDNRNPDPMTQVVSRESNFSYADNDDEADLFEFEGETLTVTQFGGEPVAPMWSGVGDMTLGSRAFNAESVYMEQQGEASSANDDFIETVEIDHVMADSTLSSAIPSNKPWPGQYNFSLIFQEQPVKVTKSTSWTYSDTLEKLFINMGFSCIVSFKVDRMPPPGCMIRALPVFEKAEHLREVVKRCPTHCLPTDRTNIGHADPEHLVRCDSDLAVYQTDPYSYRQSVIVPFQAPQAGADNSEYLYKFMCFGSCVGGLNRRPIMLIFTLEKDGQVLGRRPLRVRICACPGRDRKTEEKHLEIRHLNLYASEMGATSGCSRVLNHTTTTDIISMVPPPSKRLKTDDSDIYTITIKGRANYEVLVKVKQALELADLAPPSAVQAYRNEQVQMSRTNSAIANVPSSSQARKDFGFTEQPKGPSSLRSPMSTQGSSRSGPTTTVPLRRLPSAGSSRAAHTSDEIKTSVQTKREATDSVVSWLEEIGMAAYADTFTKHGLTDMMQLENFGEDDLADLKIGLAHREKIWNALKECHSCVGGSQPSSQASTFSNVMTASTSGQGPYYQISRYRFKRVKSMKLSDQ